MPLYDICHIVPLTQDQRDELAEGITKIHSEAFTTPKLLVNVHFTDTSTKAAYVGGKHRPSNMIKAHVRHGPSRSRDAYKSLCAEISTRWKDIVGNEGEHELRTIFVLGDIVAGWEAGFEIPEAGKDKEWLKVNMQGFEEKAKEGDQDFKDLVVEVKQRKELQ